MFDEVYERIMAKCIDDPETGCKLYQGQTDGRDDPYGRISYRGQTIAVHLAVWKKHKGKIPKGKQVEHGCNRRLCCEIGHYDAVTPKGNSKLRERRKRFRNDPLRCLEVKVRRKHKEK